MAHQGHTTVGHTDLPFFVARPAATCRLCALEALPAARLQTFTARQQPPRPGFTRDAALEPAEEYPASADRRAGRRRRDDADRDAHR
eukprot:2664796-Prymnesium_polylepis.1